MPRFFFNVRDEAGFAEDEEGLDLARAEEARDIAIDGARSILSDQARQGRVDLRGRVEVADAGGVPLFSVDFAEAVEVVAGPLDIPDPAAAAGRDS